MVTIVVAREELKEMKEIVKVEHLKKYFKEVKAVDDISFSVEKGELFGFLGVNGAGKSTLLKLITREIVPTQGRVFVNGYNLTNIKKN